MGSASRDVWFEGVKVCEFWRLYMHDPDACAPPVVSVLLVNLFEKDAAGATSFGNTMKWSGMTPAVSWLCTLINSGWIPASCSEKKTNKTPTHIDGGRVQIGSYVG